MMSCNSEMSFPRSGPSESAQSFAPPATTLGLRELAHALRNCFSVGIGLTEILDAEFLSESPYRDRVRLIAKALKKANRIVHTAVTLSEPGHCRRMPTVPNAVFAAAVKALTTEPGGHIRLGRMDEIVLLVDPDQAAEALTEILQNALETSCKEVRVEVEQDAGEGRFRVSDDGPGVPVDDMPHIFTPFFSTKGGSNGLGLSLAARLVALNSGRIEFESSSQGTTFSLIFPLAPR
jgi:two-component system sensor histidine kinase PilS (NtrC family)